MNKLNPVFRKLVQSLVALLCLFVTSTLMAQVQILEESTVTNEGLYFWYPDGEKAYHYNPNISPRGDCVSVVNGYIFFGWYKGGMTKRDLMISRKKIGSGDWVTVQLPHKNTLIGAGNKWGDSHQTISVGVSKIDGTVHIFYDHHNDPLKYIVSKKNKAFAPDNEFNLSAFEDTRGYLAQGQPVTITYPKITQNEEGEIILNYRKGSAVGGNEMVHVYNGVEWTRSKQVTRGGGVPYVAEEDKNYAYGVPYYNNGNVYYAFSVRWAAKQDDGVLNEGVYLAKCGPAMTSPWEDPNGVKHTLPIQDYSPFLIDLPDSNGMKGSSGGPGLVVSEDGDVHVTYDGRGSGSTYVYTYTRKAGESNFTKHTGVRKTGLSWNNRFYTIGASGSGRITITSGEPGTLNYTTELIHETGRSFGVSSSYIADGKLVLIVSEDKNSDKKDIYSYVFQLPDEPGIVGLSNTSIKQNEPVTIPFTVSSMETSGLSITATSSNTGLVPNAGIVVGGSGANRTLIITPAAGQGGKADISVEAENGAESVRSDFTLTVVRSLLGSTSDAEVQPTLTTPPYTVSSQGSASLALGTAGNNLGKDRCVVIPFQLPDLGAVANPFYSASFTVNHESNVNTPLGNVSVYGLGSRGDGSVLTDDYWSATSDEDSSDATMLQATFIAAGSSSFGLKTTDTTGSANLRAYLNAQYNGGAGIGDYVFLRLSVDAAQSGGAHRYAITSADGAVTASDSAIHPQISYLTVGEVEVPEITQVALGSPVNLTDGSSWSDRLPPHAGASYIIPFITPYSASTSGNLRGETGTTTFPGLSLTVERSGRFQVRALQGSGEVTKVNQLILEGGTSFDAGDYVELAAGTGNNETNVLDGAIMNSGHTRFLTYGIANGSTVARSLKILSRISGSGRIQARESSALGMSSVIIENPENSFSGVWEVAAGSILVFSNADAVGFGDIEVQDGGRLEIMGDWSSSASLAVADASNTLIDLGSYDWSVAGLILGDMSVPENTYSSSDLNALGANPVFTGSGTITVGDGVSNPAIEDWRELHFGTTDNTIPAADDYDANFDGEDNLLEFATGQDPYANTLVESSLNLNGGTLEFRYTRSNAAVADGIQFTVAWSDTLLPGSWSSAGVIDTMDPENLGDSGMENRLATIPAGSAGRRFIHLKISNP